VLCVLDYELFAPITVQVNGPVINITHLFYLQASNTIHTSTYTFTLFTI